MLGGSFNPAHEGHLHVAKQAMVHCRLDQLWLMVSPGNPLKPSTGMAPFAERLASARKIADGRRIIATDIEKRLGTKFTADTMAALRRRFAGAKFVWLMGADNLAQLPKWDRWQRVVHAMPMLILPRPGQTRKALAGQAVKRMARHRLEARSGLCLAQSAPPAWILLPVKENPASATALRARIAETSLTEEFAVIARPPSRTTTTARAASAAPRKRAPKKANAATEALPAMPGTPRKKAIIAGPRGKKTQPKTTLPELERMQKVICESLDEDKAEDIVAIDLAGRASFADRMVIATGLADRQISAMAAHLNEKLVEAGFKKTRLEGAGGTDWVLIDAGDIIVHLFKPDARILYGLEKMWGPDLDEVEPDPS